MKSPICRLSGKKCPSLISPSKKRSRLHNILLLLTPLSFSTHDFIIYGDYIVYIFIFM